MNRRSFFKRAGMATAVIATGSILSLIPEEKLSFPYIGSAKATFIPKEQFEQKYPLTPDECFTHKNYETVIVQSDGKNWNIISDMRKDLYELYLNGVPRRGKGGIYRA